VSPIWFTRTRILGVAAALQAACGLLLLVDILSELPELEANQRHAALEIAIVATLLFGSALIVGEFRRMQAQADQMTTRLRAASGAFVALVEESFAAWGLTPAEREVALLALKGFAVAEIASLRGAREGTVRAQCAAVYRKAGVSGRPQLIAHFVDDLLAGADLGAGFGPGPEAKGR
jgi:DNA-binding CsgD family transcriptional regulator